MVETVAEQFERIAAEMAAAPTETPAQELAVTEAYPTLRTDLAAQIPGRLGRGALGRLALEAWNAFSGGAEKKRLAAEMPDLNIEGAPAYARMMADLPPDADDQLMTLHRELEKHHDAPVEFRFDETANDLVYDVLSKPREEGGQVTSSYLVDEPGASFADIADISGELPTILGESAGLALSVLAKNPAVGRPIAAMGRWVRHLIAAAAGAYVGESARVEGAAATGSYPHKTREEITAERMSEAGKAAALSATFTAAGAGAGMLFKSIANLVNGRVIPEQFMEWGRQIEGSIEPYVDELNAFLKSRGRPERIEPTTGELLNEGFPLQLERKMTDQPGMGQREAFLERKVEQAAALEAGLKIGREEVLDPILPPPPGHNIPPVGPLAVGRAVKEPIETAYDSAEGALIAATEAGRVAVGDKQALIEWEAGQAGRDLGPPLRNVGEAEQLAFRNWADDEYTSIAALSDGLTGPAKPLREEVERQGQLFADDLAANLTVENRATVEGITARFAAIDAAGGGVSIDQLNRLISQLKTAVRAADNGLLGTTDIGALRQLIGAAVESRRRMTNKRKGLSARLADLESTYATRKTELNNTILGRVMKRKNGVWQIADENVFDQVFRPGGITDAKFFASILSEPKHAAMKEEFQRAIYRRYLDANSVDGLVDPKKHADWLKKYDGVIEPYFEGKANPLLGEMGDVLRALQKSTNDEAAAIAVMKKEFGWQMRSWSPDLVASKIWAQTGTAEAVRETLEGLGRQDIWRSVQHYLINNLEKGIKTHRMPGLTDRAISARSLDTFLNDAKGTNREKIISIFGPDYLTTLELVRDAGIAVQRSLDFKNFSNTANTAAGKIQWSEIAAIATKMYIGPLHRISRWVTGAQKAEKSVQLTNLSKVLLNPRDLAALVKSAVTQRPTRWAQMELANIIAHLASNDNVKGAKGVRPTGGGIAEGLRESLPPAVRAIIGGQ